MTALDKDSRALVLADGARMEFDAILLATGADPVVPPLGVSVGGRVLCMRTVADAKPAAGAAGSGRHPLRSR